MITSCDEWIHTRIKSIRRLKIFIIRESKNLSVINNM